MPTWQIVDADQIAAGNKYTFYKPSREIIKQVQVGENVKLIFRFTSDDLEAPRGERIKVRVDEVGKQGAFRGRVANSPRFITDLRLGDAVGFQACHIVGTQHDPVDTLVSQYEKWCLVSNRVLCDGVKVGFLSRAEPVDDQDSGWTITADDESDEYMDDPDNTALVSLGEVLREDDSILDLLDSPVESAFFRDAGTGEFIPLADDGLDHVCACCRDAQREAENLRMKNGAPSAASLH